MPIAARYVFTERRWAPYAEFGIAPAIYINSVDHTNFDVGPDQHHKYVDSSINLLHLFAQAALGVQYAHSTRRQFFAQPTYRYQLNALKNASIKEHLYSTGLEIGTRIGF